MSPVTESAVVRVARAFRAAILADDAEQMALLADRYLQLELSLEDTIAALAERIANMDDATYWQIQRLETYQRYQLRLLAELDKYNAWVAENVREGQLRFAGLGTDHAAATLETARRGASVPLTSAERDRLMAMVGYAGDGSPLSTLLAQSGDYVRAAVTQKLLRAVATAQNPRITAREIRKATGMALNRAMAIARTEQLRVYREATAASYRASGIQWYQRIAARDPATCLACLSLDGEISTSDASVDDHVAGRCTSVPIIPGVANPQMEPVQSWFDRQDEATQRAMMGDARYSMYTSGQVSWSDLGRRVADPTWGSAPQVVPVRDLAASASAAA